MSTQNLPAAPEERRGSWKNVAWDAFCIASVIGLWPRFIEHKLISTTRLHFKLDQWPSDTPPITLLQISDLHLKEHCTDRFLKKILRRIDTLSPDIVVITGDLLCYGKMMEEERLKRFLKNIPTRLGCFATLGNHDYARYISVNRQGDYDVVHAGANAIGGGFKRLLRPKTPSGIVTDTASQVPPNPELLQVFDDCRITLLDNQCIQIKNDRQTLNLCGLGDYWAGRCLPKLAFQNYDLESPGIILSHNPDSIKLLADCPGDLILCGHTHGGQVNLPFICPRIMATENPHLKRGLWITKGKQIYINRGVGTVIPFRWFSRPELLFITLKGKSP